MIEAIDGPPELRVIGLVRCNFSNDEA